MKKKVLLFWMLASTPLLAQKVDLDRFHFNVAYQSLPKENVPFEKRTYGLHVKSSDLLTKYIPESKMYEQINIEGWKKVENSPTVGIDFVLEDFVYKGVEVKSETINEKDKDGNIKSSTTNYWVEAKYSARGYAKYTGPFTAIKETPKVVEQAKAVNRFLTNAVINKPAENTTGDEQQLSFNKEIIHASDKKTNRDIVAKDFNSNKDAIYEQTVRNYVQGSINNINNTLNRNYGFLPVSTRDILWILDAKNEEGKTQSEAIEAVKELFNGMKADVPTDQLAQNLKPLIEYFESLKTKYAADDKPSRKIRYSAYFNLAKIYYYLDDPDNCIKQAEGLIKNDYDPKDGKNLIEDATKLKDLFIQTKFSSRHNPSLK